MAIDKITYPISTHPAKYNHDFLLSPGDLLVLTKVGFFIPIAMPISPETKTNILVFNSMEVALHPTAADPSAFQLKTKTTYVPTGRVVLYIDHFPRSQNRKCFVMLYNERTYLCYDGEFEKYENQNL